jgi:hypothetical protein
METHNDLSIFIQEIGGKFEYSKSEKKSFFFSTNKSSMEVLISHLELYPLKGTNSYEEITWDDHSVEIYSIKTGIKTTIYSKQ